MSSLLKILGERIRIVRLTEKISQKELAAKTNLSVVTIGQIERGNANVSINNLNAIAASLNCQITIDLDLKSDLAEASKKKKLAP
jgi:transcriptional regulator with XRE-family HTH domain